MNNLTPEDRKAYRNFRLRNTPERSRQLMLEREVIRNARDI